MVFYLRQLINQSQVSKRHKSMPRYSNLKMKPNLQSDVFLLCDKNKNISTDLNIKNKSLSFKGRDKALKWA